MLKPNEIEAVSMAFDEQMKQLENRIMQDIVRRVKINGEITRSADWQINRIYQLGLAKEDIKNAIAEHLNLSYEEIQEMYCNAAESGYVRDKDLYIKSDKSFVEFEDNEPIQQLLLAVSAQTYGEIKNITKSLGFAVKKSNGKIQFSSIADYYQKTLDNAIFDILSGAFDYNTVLKRIVYEMTNSGLRSVDYASGWSNRVDVAARRAVMTGLSQITAKINEQNSEELHTKYFEVSWHSGARPSHQVWQGRVYTKEQLTTVCGLGSVTGLCGANCYHDYYPFIPGISERTYTNEELDEMNAQENKPQEYNGKQYTKYEALQRQRRLETTMRAQRQQIKLLGEGGADEEDIINARCRYRATSSEYSRFSKAMNLPQQRERVTVDGLGNIGVGKTKVDLTFKDYDDIIYMKGKMSDRDARKWYIAHNKMIPDLIDTTKSVEEQAMQACILRNKHKLQARKLMKDQEKRKRLDISDPIESFETIVKRKMKDKNMSYDEAVQDIIKTATKTRKSVNDVLGVEG